MRTGKKLWAIFLIWSMIVTMIPAGNIASKAATERFAITAPVENKLMAAGHFDIVWNKATSGTVRNYKLYIDGILVTTTTATSYDYYTTSVKKYEAYVVAEYSDGKTETTEKRTFAVTKKGLAVNNTMGKNLRPLEMNMGWYYNWSSTPFSYTSYQFIEYVPMK